MDSQRCENNRIRNIYRDILICLVVILTTAAVYWQVRNYDFINYDDNIYVFRNAHVLSGLTPESIYWAFTSTKMMVWQPMVWLSFMTDQQRIRPKDSEVFRLCCDNSKIRRLTGFEPKYSLRQGLKRTIKWFSQAENLSQYKTDIHNV